MNNTQLTINKAVRNKAGQSLLAGLCLVSASFVLAATPAAATNDNTTQDNNKTNTAYVDSVLKWGAWELDIEPAAGGLQPQATQALNARDAKANLRTNSISVLAPRGRSPAPLPVAPLPTISGPTAPTTFSPPGGTTVTTFSPPPSPNTIPVSTTTPLPTGNGSLF